MRDAQATRKEPRFILFFNDDFKFKQWKVSLERDYGYSCKASKSAVFVFFLIPFLFKKGKVESVVFRYLNDRKSWFKSVSFLISDLLIYGLCSLFQIKIHWILHNIDKESSINFPTMIKHRRRWIASKAKKIFVIDQLLVELAKEAFPDHKNKIDHISFGRYSSGMIARKIKPLAISSNRECMNFSFSLFDELIDVVKSVRPDYDLIAFCGGRYSKKRMNFQELPNLVEGAKKANLKFLMILVSDFSRTEDKRLFDYCTEASDIMFVNNLLEMNEFAFQGLIDFYWNGYSDISIPYTVYTAATLEIPVISYDSGILPKVVSHYKIGEVVKADYSNLESLSRRVRDKDNYAFSEFLELNYWNKTADKLVASLKEDTLA
jgi:hypothetical protein